MTSTSINNVEIDVDAPIDISIPLNFNGAQPTYFGADPANSEPFVTGSFTGDTRLGGSCNVESIRLVPHCNGTHTECAGHITKERRSIADIAPVLLIPATLVTIAGPVVTESVLSRALAKAEKDWLTGLVIRTSVSSDPCKNHDDGLASWIEPEAVRLLEEYKVDHLLTDLPSIDHPESEDLPGHHAFWGIGGNGVPVSESLLHRTITEMIFIPASVPDGKYGLTIAWPRFVSDAAPSRPVLYPPVLYPPTAKSHG